MHLSLRMRLLFGTAGGLLAVSACGPVEESDSEPTVRKATQRSVVTTEAADTLEVYAAKCDAATGIHVPAFSCTAGLPHPAGDHFVKIDQGTSIDNIEKFDPVGTTTGTRDEALDPNDPTVQRINAGPGNISGTADNFRYAYVSHSADGVFGEHPLGTMEVKINGYDSFGPGAMAGIMVRVDPNDGADNLDQDAPHAMLGIGPGGNVLFFHRATKGATTSTPIISTGHGFPTWLRLSWQAGIGVKAETSQDHDTWQTIGTAPVMGPGISAPLMIDTGIAVSSASVNYQGFFTTKRCDTPSALGSSCDVKSSFQVLARTADAIAVANCRNYNLLDGNQFSDIAVIQYNRKNGALCFYQNNLNLAPADGSWVSAPSDGGGSFDWWSPEETHGGDCTGCHDTGGLIRSPYVMKTGLMPEWGEGYDNDGANPLRYVGHAFEDDRSYWVEADVAVGDAGDDCGDCHGMAVNNVNFSYGTSMRFAFQATSTSLSPDDSFFLSHKNPASATSPLWMRPTSTAPDRIYPDGNDPLEVAAAAATAANFRNCGDFLQGQATSTAPQAPFDIDPSHWSSPPNPLWGCSFSENGVPYGKQVNIISDAAWGNGGSSAGTLENVIVTSGANTDIYGNSDTGVLAATLVSGDGSAIVKVESLTNSNEYAKAGLMLRSGVAANAPNVMIALTAQHGATFQYRPSAGAATQTAYLSNPVNFPLWLRLERSGESFVGSVSTDNRDTWQQVGEAITIAGFGGSHLGLVNTSHGPGPGQATFRAFDFTPAEGWEAWTDPHILVDARIGSASGNRTEWITREYIDSSGGDIYGNADDFLYSFKTFNGDGTLTTTVETFNSTAQWGKAGLMMRDGAADNAKNVFVGRRPGGVSFQYRDATGGSTTVNHVNTADAPMSFRITRTGNTLAGSYRVQGDPDWIPLGSHTFSSFNPEALTGLAVSSENSWSQTSAVFFSEAPVQPPGFKWLSGTPDPDPDPDPGLGPCDGLCTLTSAPFDIVDSYWSGHLGTGAICRETTATILGGNCSNFFNGRQLSVNGQQKICNGGNWWTIPPARNGGFCLQATAGQSADAAFQVWE